MIFYCVYGIVDIFRIKEPIIFSRSAIFSKSFNVSTALDFSDSFFILSGVIHLGRTKDWC